VPLDYGMGYILLLLYINRIYIKTIIMNEVLKTYLEWRFRVNNAGKYQRYRDEWIKALLPTQISYFEKEMNHMIENGLYK
jgi:hypothetical protein